MTEPDGDGLLGHGRGGPESQGRYGDAEDHGQLREFHRLLLDVCYFNAGGFSALTQAAARFG
jgi:hypothetical protein